MHDNLHNSFLFFFFTKIIGLRDDILYVFIGSEYLWIKRCHGNICHIYKKILSESIVFCDISMTKIFSWK